jgi:hypothetical protein
LPGGSIFSTVLEDKTEGSMGENRYMGGENASLLNVDWCSPRATVEEGRLVV